MKNSITLTIIIVLAVFSAGIGCKTAAPRDAINLTDEQLLAMSDTELKDFADRQVSLNRDSGDFYYEQYRQLLKRKRDLEEQRRKAAAERKGRTGVRDTAKKKSADGQDVQDQRNAGRREVRPDAQKKGLSYVGKERREDLIAKKYAIRARDTDDKKNNLPDTPVPDRGVIKPAKKESSARDGGDRDDSKSADSRQRQESKRPTDDSINNGGRTETQAYDSYQFSLTKGQRLMGFSILNGPGKDYHLMQDPTPGSSRYYFITDRKTAFTESRDEALKSLSQYRADLGEAAFGAVEKSLNETPPTKGTGMLEIIACESMLNANGTRDAFFTPRFTNIKDLSVGDKLGFALFYHPRLKHLEIYYAADGDLHHAVSTDGITFTGDHRVDILNSAYSERDPAISRDGKILVFASSRNYGSDSGGVQLFVALRNSVDEQFGEPIVVPTAFNSVGELFPTIYQCPEGTFIIFKKFFSGTGNVFMSHFSIEIKGNTLLPMVPFGGSSDLAYKYITTSYSDKRGNRIISSYPVNGYDLFRMYLSEPRRVRIDEAGEIIDKK